MTREFYVNNRNRAKQLNGDGNQITIAQQSSEESDSQEELANDLENSQLKAGRGERRRLKLEKMEWWKSGKWYGWWKQLPAKPRKSQASSHQTNAPPRATTIAVPDLHQISENEWNQLDSMVLDVYEKNCLTKEMQREMKILVANMETAIRKEMPNARLDLFGSAVNGCGAFNCDLNICFRFKEDIQPKNHDPKLVLRKIKHILVTKYKEIKPSLFLSINWPIPIVKFKLHEIMGDITYYNDIGLKSTALFRKYCEWEPHRFPQLILVVKRWAKDCNINSSKNGTLSSSALSLMLVHFLQQCSPPVLPPWDLNRVIIPQRYDFAKMPVIKNWSQNTESVGRLFVGFLDYYSRFDFRNLISILRKDLSWFMDLDDGKSVPLAIEDPYLPEFNSGYRVKDQIGTIRAVFRNSRAFLLSKRENLICNESLNERRTSFNEEEGEVEEVEDTKRYPLKELQKDKRNQQKKPYVPRFITEYTKKIMVRRIFKAIFYCGGEGTFNELKKYYRILNRRKFFDDIKYLYGTNQGTEIFGHPFMETCLVLNKNWSFKLADELHEEVKAFMDRLYGFSGDKDKEMLEEGARRMFKVLRERKIDWKSFLIRYRKIFGVAFDDNERKKYFGTTTMYKIIGYVSPYGIKVTPNHNGQPLFTVKKKFKVTLREINEEVKRLIKKIYSMANEDVTVTVTVDVDQIKRALGQFSFEDKERKKYPTGTEIQEKAIKKAYKKPERKQLLGKDKLSNEMFLLNEHGVDISNSNGMYSDDMDQDVSSAQSDLEEESVNELKEHGVDISTSNGRYSYTMQKEVTNVPQPPR